ncbi:MAG: 50S ribosomal protein L18 [Planctomycetota bacterium]
MNPQNEKRRKRIRRHRRVRKKVFGTEARPRLAVFRSLKHIYGQIIDDTAARTLVSASTLQADIRKELAERMTGGLGSASAVGRRLAEKALAHGIKKVVLDRGGYKYHGRVKALADAARESGLVL